MEGLEQILSEHPFFAGFDSAHSRLISGCARNHRFNAGHYLFREGEPANEFFLIRRNRRARTAAHCGLDPQRRRDCGGIMAGAALSLDFRCQGR
jgi:CRP/FNR family cyclic AMP-dependent transcriptional regulator